MGEIGTDVDQVVQPTDSLGPQPLFKKLGMSTRSHHEHEIVTAENEFVVRIRTSQLVKVMARVFSLASGFEAPGHVFVQSKGDDVSLLISLAHIGYHCLQIHALAADDESDKLPVVFTYLIHCTAVPRKVRVFPKHFTLWTDGCALFEPFSIEPDQKGDVPFRTIVPAAWAVAITIGDEWIHLTPGDNGLWTGVVPRIEQFRDQGNSCLVVNANFSEDDETTYHSLLNFKI